MNSKKELYIDFDGVILDTIPLVYKAFNDNNIDMSDTKAKTEFLAKYDYSKMIDKKYILRDSIKCINKLIKSNRFIISLLTHVNSLEEGILKVNFIRNYFKDITIIIVPKEISKTKMVHSKDAILVDDYSQNLTEWEKEGGIGVRFSIELESKGFKVIDKLDQLLDIF